MFRRLGLLVSLITLMGFVGVATASAAPVATCTPTGFVRDGIDLTAKVINPTKTVNSKVDATGCNIGVYIDRGSVNVNGAEIFGANYFGVVVNGDVNVVNTDVVQSSIHDIGEKPLNGSQHGIAIYYRAYMTGKAIGRIANNNVFKCQKGGISVAGSGESSNIDGNTVTGQGPVDYIAQNGIQVAYGADANVTNNRVTGNQYTGAGPASSGGILIVGGDAFSPCPNGVCAYVKYTKILSNNVLNNDVGVFIYQADAAGNPPATETGIVVRGNTIRNNAVTNTSGNGGTPPTPYQAGVSEFGNNDKIVENEITGAGYNPNTVPGSTFAVDTRGSIHPRVRDN